MKKSLFLASVIAVALLTSCGTAVQPDQVSVNPSPLTVVGNKVEAEIKALREACADKILKVIIETCYLTEEEKIAMCKAVTNAKADYIKTSTGFGTGGATLADVILMRENIGADVKIKAAGGISSMADAEKFMELGATRLGTSRIVKIVKNEAGSGY